MRFKLLMGVAALGLAGCTDQQSAPTAATGQGDSGAPLTQADAEKIVAAAEARSSGCFSASTFVEIPSAGIDCFVQQLFLETPTHRGLGRRIFFYRLQPFIVFFRVELRVNGKS